MKLYELKRGEWFTLPKQQEPKTPIRFDHLDGMYSFCTTQDGAVAHVFAAEEVEKIERPNT